MYDNYEQIESCGMIVMDGCSILLIERNGKWDLPKGKREEGESYRQTALRELEEETGIRENEVQVLCELIPTYHFTNYDNVDAVKTTRWYLGEHRGDKNNVLYPEHDEGIEQAVWVPISIIEEYTPVMRDYARYVLQFALAMLRIERKRKLQS